MLFVVRWDTTHCKSGEKQDSSHISLAESSVMSLSSTLNIGFTPIHTQYAYTHICVLIIVKCTAMYTVCM